jgi:hypothetical protein
LAPVARIHRMLRRREHQRPGLEHVRQRAGVILGVRLDLREGDMARWRSRTCGSRDWSPASGRSRSHRP